MGLRSRLLYDIEQALERHDIGVRLSSIEDLKKALPGYPGKFFNRDLEVLLSVIPEVKKSHLQKWLTPVRRSPKGSGDRSRSTKSHLSIAEIVQMRSDRVPVPEIATIAGVTTKRIYQILSKEKCKYSQKSSDDVRT